MIDYTKVFAGARTSYDEGLRSYMLKIYNYMALALVITGIAAFATLNFEPLTRLMFQVTNNGAIAGVSGFGKLLMFAPLAMSIFFAMGINRMSTDSAKVFLWIYAGVLGMSLSSIGLIYTSESIARTFFICAATFGATSIYGYTTKKDLTSMGSFMLMGLMGIVIASVVNMFIGSSAVNFATSLLGIVIFTGLIAWDTQKLKAIYYTSGGGEMGQKMAVVGAFNLYLDFINLFLSMLRFFGNRRD